MPTPRRRHDDEELDEGDDTEIAIVRGSGAKRLIESFAGGSKAEEDEAEEWTDDDGQTWVKKVEKATKKATKRAAPAKKKGWFD